MIHNSVVQSEFCTYWFSREKNFNETKDILLGIRNEKDLNSLCKSFSETQTFQSLFPIYKEKKPLVATFPIQLLVG